MSLTYKSKYGVYGVVCDLISTLQQSILLESIGWGRPMNKTTFDVQTETAKIEFVWKIPEYQASNRPLWSKVEKSHITVPMKIKPEDLVVQFNLDFKYNHKCSVDYFYNGRLSKEPPRLGGILNILTCRRLIDMSWKSSDHTHHLHYMKYTDPDQRLYHMFNHDFVKVFREATLEILKDIHDNND